MNFENNYNLYNYTNLKNMSAINEILLNLIPSDLINDVMSYDAHTCCMKEIRERERKEYDYERFNENFATTGNYRIRDILTIWKIDPEDNQYLKRTQIVYYETYCYEWIMNEKYYLSDRYQNQCLLVLILV